jgi:predicted lipoprotein with Yx(FWY)xxD motif
MTARLRLPLAAALVVGVVAALVVPAVGKAPPTLTLRSVHSASLNRFVVANPAGRTLYHRTGETTHRVVCTGSCKSIWPPLTVRSTSTRLVKGSGVTGTLGKFRRADGLLQVTLNGQPLYRFSSDRRAGDAAGEGIPGEGRGGGVWHAVRASAPRRTTSTPPPATMTQPTYTAPPGYTYP